MYIEPALLVDSLLELIFFCNLLGDKFVVRRSLVGFIVGTFKFVVRRSLVGFIVGTFRFAFLLVYEVKYRENVFST